jgi:hypothetical protein
MEQARPLNAEAALWQKSVVVIVSIGRDRRRG